MSFNLRHFVVCHKNVFQSGVCHKNVFQYAAFCGMPQKCLSIRGILLYATKMFSNLGKICNRPKNRQKRQTNWGSWICQKLGQSEPPKIRADWAANGWGITLFQSRHCPFKMKWNSLAVTGLPWGPFSGHWPSFVYRTTPTPAPPPPLISILGFCWLTRLKTW